MGSLVFADNKYRKRPVSCVKTQSACTVIAEAHHMAATSRSDVPSYQQDKKRSRDSPNQGGSDYNKKSKSEDETRDCYMCGRTNHRSDQCRLKNHPHANKDKDVAWKDSKWGNIYATKLPHVSLELNARHIAVADSDGKYILEKWNKPALTDRNKDRDYKRNKPDDRRDRHNKSDRKSNYGVSQTATTNLHNFVTGKSTFNPLISARSVNTETILGRVYWIQEPLEATSIIT